MRGVWGCARVQYMTHNLLPSLPPEPFGRKLTRAREDVARLRLDQLASVISQWHPCNPATLSRLENDPAMMPNKNPIIMCLAVVACGFDPQSFGLSWDDLPQAWDRDRVIDTLQPALVSPCNPARRNVSLSTCTRAHVYCLMSVGRGLVKCHVY